MAEARRTIAVGFTNAVDRRLVCGYLDELGYGCVHELPPAEAPVDLILLDKAHARRLGPQVAAAKERSAAFLPAVVALPRTDGVGPWLAAGFDNYLRLPATKAEFANKLEIMLRLRRQSEALLQKSEYFHKALIDSSTDHIFVLDRTGRYVSSNDRVAHFDLSAGKELVGKTIEDVFPPQVAALYRARFQQVLETGRSVSFEHELPGASLSHHHIDILYPIGLPSGERLVGGICRDITARKQAEEAIRASEARYRSVFESTGTAMIIIDPDGTVALANKECRAAFGYSPEQLQGTRSLRHIAPEDRDEAAGWFREHFEGRLDAPTRHEVALYDADGEIRHCLATMDTIPDTGQLVVSLLDITERIRAEESRRLLATAIDHTQECVFITDRQNTIIYVNQAFEKLTGYARPEALGRSPSILKSGRQDPAFYRQLKRDIHAGRPWTGHMINRRKDGTHYEVFATITPVFGENGRLTHFISVHRDVTREREAERRLQQNQRLEAIGTLAGGIAHDFNNILAPILGYTELCIEALPPGSRVREDLEQVMLAANRAKGLVQQILAFSRQKESRRQPLNPRLIVREALKLIRASLPATIDIRQQVAVGDVAILADPTEIHQVLMNLCTNAYHAMPEGGTLTVGLETVALDAEQAGRLPGLSPGRCLKLSVSDTGCGIPADVLDKIFEPYFTTKDEYRGTGLGLAIVHGIVSSLGGTVTVYSEVGHGTRFDLYFPLLEADQRQAPVEAPAVTGGSERILFVDDDPAIAALGGRALERHGYRVTVMNDPRRALAALAADPAAYDLLVTDLTMPGMTGVELARAVARLRPAPPVILCTGFSERMAGDAAEASGIRRVLHKPVAPAELARAVRDLLDRRTAGSDQANPPVTLEITEKKGPKTGL